MALRGGLPGTRTYLFRRRPVLARTAAAAVFFFGALALQAQISPGPLSRPHQDLSGPTQCTSCHVVGGGSATLKCQECHTEIAAEISGGHGLHSRFANKNDCAKCHSEHNGEDFPLIHWQPSLKAFDHTQTGYSLQGKHSGLECNQCHTTAHIQPSVRPLIKMKDLRETFLGLSQDCVTCHQDPHKGQLGANCLQCHNFIDWKSATQFDHSKTKFPLTGLHAQVSCDKCHAPATPGSPARFTGMAFAKCSDCHTDPHHGAFPQSCETCHTTAGWKRIPEAQQFDHSKTKFPLLGKHVEVNCVKCHAEGNFKKPVAFAKCADCHSPDPHNGQFADRKDRGECSACHTVDGWKPSLFDVKAHAATAYALQGKHATVECAKCHIPAGTATRYKIPFAKCLDCHKDAHDGQFAAAPYNGQCEGCHTVKGFHPSTFTIAQHQKSRFALAGAHLAVTCDECHTASKAGYASKVVPYRFADRSCTGCHTDPHEGRFQQQMAQRRPDGSPKGCEACHTVKSWLDLPKFDHSKTKFPLLGAHANVACDDCHKPGADGKLTEASFRSTSTECSACHQDPHAGQFVKAGKPEGCEQCHKTDHWKPSSFNHETQSNFSLKGAHEKVACELCHTGRRNIDGKSVVFYKPTDRDCASCHN
jgi:Cytochrome c7 and related cytochrome c